MPYSYPYFFPEARGLKTKSGVYSVAGFIATGQ
ncbi:protein of unknown function [Aminobacter niigataensis]|nr:protein of unknown function [Aminobacter niigataensis]